MESPLDASNIGPESLTAEGSCLRKSRYDSNGVTEEVRYEAGHTRDGPYEEKDDTNSETTDTEVNPDIEASRYLEQLVRKHLERVMEKHGMTTIPSPRPSVEFNEALKLAPLIAAALECDSDVALGRLLETVINVYRTSQAGLTKAIEDCLKQTIHLMRSPIDGEIGDMFAFLQTVMEELERCEASGTTTSSSEPMAIATTGSSIVVSINDSTEEIAFENILSCFWGSKLDTDCHHCHKPFQNEPPVRTIARKSSVVQNASSKLHVRIFNRHFACWRTNETFVVPVSHVWDNSIRIANESKEHNSKAAFTMFETLKALLAGAADAYEPEVEFWHDYFSVPQWEPETKEALLLILPAIYSSCDEILVHMPDLPTSSVLQLFLDHEMGEHISLKKAIHRIPLMCDLCNSQWMQRMWVTLEYFQAKAACVMDHSNKIWRNRDAANGLFARDTFTELVKCGNRQGLGMFRWARIFALTLNKPGSFLDSLETRQDMQKRQLCLGEVMELLSTKQSQVLRDRFLAIYLILNPRPAPSDPPTIPKSDTDACLWVWRNALSKGDYSPLLLQPREPVSSNLKPPLLSWLVGCQSLDGAAWGLGKQERPAKENPVVTEFSVAVVLHKVGTITAIHYLGTENSGEVKGVDQVLQILFAIASTEGFVLSPKDIFKAMGCVFPFDNLASEFARRKRNMVSSFDNRQMRDPELNSKLSEQLSIYTEYFNKGESALMLDAAQSITTLLQLDTDFTEGISIHPTCLARDPLPGVEKNGVLSKESLCVK